MSPAVGLRPNQRMAKVPCVLWYTWPKLMALYREGYGTGSVSQDPQDSYQQFSQPYQGLATYILSQFMYSIVKNPEA